MTEFRCGNCCGGMCADGCSRHADKLNTFDWLADLPDNATACDIVEVQFKPPRKGYFINSNNLPLAKGDVVAVEGNPGHDIGTVTMTGRLVPLQLKKANLKPGTELKKIYRKARQVDMDKFHEAKAREHETMIESRQIALNLGLKMKIGDVEYQGDGNKAIFYYIADERVDFRQLIKVLAERFRVRIEMKQIGARQEAGRIGGIGPCGRELCCATWMTNFVSVSTSAARFQDISLNPQKLAGQCAKLKCCLNYEVDQYVESLKRLPSREITLHTKDNEYYFFKADILAHKITYSTDKHLLVGEKTISAPRAFDIIQMNREGIKPESLLEDGFEPERVSLDLLDQDNINRFDRKKGESRRKKDDRRKDKDRDRDRERDRDRQKQGRGNKSQDQRKDNDSHQDAQSKQQQNGEQKNQQNGGQPKQQNGGQQNQQNGGQQNQQNAGQPKQQNGGQPNLQNGGQQKQQNGEQQNQQAQATNQQSSHSQGGQQSKQNRHKRGGNNRGGQGHGQNNNRENNSPKPAQE